MERRKKLIWIIIVLLAIVFVQTIILWQEIGCLTLKILVIGDCCRKNILLEGHLLFGNLLIMKENTLETNIQINNIMTSMNNIRIFIMKICYICCAIAMSYIAISCLSENKIIDRSSPVLIVNLDSTKVSEFRYSDIFKSVTAIELDEKDALLGGIDKMQIYKSQLFVLDSRSTKGVYIFDRKGTFMRKIGNIGLAPDEYVSCDDFTINIDDNELYIFDSLQNKIYRYDISSGKFKGGILMDKNIHFNYIAYNSGCLYGAQTFFNLQKKIDTIYYSK